MADRIEREIEEILKKIENFPERGKGTRPPRKPNSPGGSTAQRWLARVSLRKVMMWALFAVIVAFLGRGIPGAYWLMIGALIVFVTAFVLSTRGGPGVKQAPEKRWRGQPLDLRQPSWPDRIKAFLKGRKRT
ncbi:MAG TPA: hypothetical protein VI876_07085 [Dehalococcoidia bacterium]|nr:hypothetical protein [Dehalococcoidia bacterium]